MDLISYARERGFGDIHIKVDPETNLHAIIAIHSTKLGPALGGCRCIEYPTTEAAMLDVLRLARAMSYKAATIGLPHGGGKSVILKPPHIEDRTAFFKAMGRFVNELGGRYIIAVDSGTSVSDMDIMSTETDYVTSLSTMDGETSLYTALGVKHGISAAVKHKLNRDSLEGLHVAIQGVGNVGYFLARELHPLGVSLTVTDIDEQAVARCVEEFDAKAVGTDDIYSIDCDIFSPCALGSIINEKTLPQLKAQIIAGAANNQLVTLKFAHEVQAKGIFYVPDYVINGGGLIYAAGKYDNLDDAEINTSLNNIYHSLLQIFERADKEGKPYSDIADMMAEEKL